MAEPIDDNQERTLSKAVQQFIDARLQGRDPDIDEFVKQYPGLEDQIRQKVWNLQKIDTLFDSLVQADESDFDDTARGFDLVGKKIGGFEIREMIGSGGMGVVYLARDTRLDRTVAIKSMPPELMDNATTRTRFMREAKLLALLSHPNIGVIHDIIEQTESSDYLVLEYVPGQTLAERITKGPLRLQEALTIALQIAEAVAAAHEHDVIHRDLKPGNIKITPEGRVKVLDFGLAKAVGGEHLEKPVTVTQPGRVIGTPAYMSPEQARGKPTDKRSDIWSFGCLMYEMLTGHLPFEGQTAADTLARIIEREPDWELLPQETPENIRALLRCCLEKNPQRRLRDIADAGVEISETLSKPATVPSVTIGVKLRRMAMIIGAVAIGIILSGIALKYIPQKEIRPSSKEIRLVVLPFENLGPAEDEYFATGLTDEVTTRLACVHGLRVYKNRDGVATHIIKELGVDYILEGTIQRARRSDPNSPVRIRPQLFRASDDSLVWAKHYDDDMREVLQIQSDLAEEIAQALDITLLEPERRALASMPTENIEAYEYYMRGNEYFNRSNLESDWRIAIQIYEKAIELDQTFALAYTQLARSHLMMYWFYYDHSDACLTMAKQAVDRAYELEPDLPEAHLALGHYYYYGHLDYDRALEQFAIARKSQPNNSQLLEWIGYVQRRQGKFEEALVNIKKASEMNPLASRLAFEVALTFELLRKYPEAERYYDRVISMSPDRPMPYAWKAQLYLLWDGKTDRARAVLQEGLETVKSTENFEIIDWLVDIEVLDGNYHAALDRLSSKSEDVDNLNYFIPNALRYARIYKHMNNDKLAEKYYNEARSILEDKIREQPEDSRFHSALGIVYAGLGRKEDAVKEGKLGVELLTVTKEAMRGLWRVEALAKIYVMVGEFDAAIDQLKILLERPGWISIPLLRLDPAWNPLRKHPRFKKLVEDGKQTTKLRTGEQNLPFKSAG
jgi:serine/threonine protein kinase/tetratricopeptide (TPR) repeat protein